MCWVLMNAVHLVLWLHPIPPALSLGVCVCVVQGSSDVQVGVALMSVAAHELLYDSWVDNKARDRLESAVTVWQPVEFVVPATGLTGPTEGLLSRWTGAAAPAGPGVHVTWPVHVTWSVHVTAKACGREGVNRVACACDMVCACDSVDMWEGRCE